MRIKLNINVAKHVANKLAGTSSRTVSRLLNASRRGLHDISYGLRDRYHTLLVVLLLIYGLIFTVSDLDYNSCYMDEAIPILIGRQLLRGEVCTGCPYMTGSVLIQPVFTALGDALGGLRGARAMNILFGLGAALIVYCTARLLLGGRFGLIAATLFLLSGQTLYLMKLATYDMIAAFFLSAAFLMIVVAEKAQSPVLRNVALLEAAVILVIASISKFILPVFMPFLLLYVLFRHGWLKTVMLVVVPFCTLAAVYYLFAPFAPRAETIGQIDNARTISQLPVTTLADWALRWVSLAYLLAVFGFFHRRHGKTAILLAVFSTPIILAHLVTGAEQSVNKNMIYALVFLAPAAAIGVDHIGHLFSMRSAVRAVRTFFAASVLVVFWAYGINNVRWLEKQYPDVTPIIGFLDRNGFDGMTVALNGWDGVIYKYTFAERFPNARYPHVTQVPMTDHPYPAFGEEVDFVVFEEFYGKQFPFELYGRYVETDYELLEYITIEHSWGWSDARIYGRKTVVVRLNGNGISSMETNTERNGP
jgi:hypothetical protein